MTHFKYEAEHDWLSMESDTIITSNIRFNLQLYSRLLPLLMTLSISQTRMLEGGRYRRT